MSVIKSLLCGSVWHGKKNRLNQACRGDRPVTRQNGFTLIELLVVITIVGVMIAMLLPSLGAARETAKAMQCMSNQRQKGHAWTYYGLDWRGMLPGWRYTWTRNIGFAGYFGETAPGRAGLRVKCPASPFLASGWSQTKNYYMDYMYNIQQVRSAAEGFHFSDYRANDGSTTYIIAENLSGITRFWFGHPNLTANVLFLDLHASAWKREEIPTLNNNGEYRHPGFTKFWRPLEQPTKLLTGFPFTGVSATPWR